MCVMPIGGIRIFGLTCGVEKYWLAFEACIRDKTEREAFLEGQLRCAHRQAVKTL